MPSDAELPIDLIADGMPPDRPQTNPKCGDGLPSEKDMIAMMQLNPPLPLNTPKGEGFAHILIDYGPESDLYWTVLITATGEIWTFSNR